MTNVYIDPSSPRYLSGALFDKETDGGILVWWYVKDYCHKRGINLQTIDRWNKNDAKADDVYLAYNHKSPLLRAYWRLTKKVNYPNVPMSAFGRRVLLQGEPATVMPEVYLNLRGLSKIYDRIYLTSQIPGYGYFHVPRHFNDVMPEYWGNKNRKFLVMINVNKKVNPYRRFLLFTRKNNLFFERDLLAERIKIIEFFSRDESMDLYGLDWDKLPIFPYWFERGAIRKIYKGPVDSKHEKLSEYVFEIATENNVTRGFVGEAIFDCFHSGTVPAYLGAPDIEDYVPKNCFVDMRDFNDYGELKKFLRSLTKEQIAAYRENGRSFLRSGRMTPFTKEYFAEFLVNIVKN